MSLPVTLLLLVLSLAGAWLSMQTKASAKDATAGLIVGFILACVTGIAINFNDPNSAQSIELGGVVALLVPTVATFVIRLFRAARRRLAR